MKVLITLTDVEPAVRLNAVLEAAGNQTTVVSPLDDLRGEIKKFKPDLIVLTGALGEPSNIQIVRDQLWNGTAVIGLADVEDPDLRERLRMIGMVDVYTKPISSDELYLAVRRVLDRQRLTEATGLIGQSEPISEVLLKIEQIAPVSSTVIIEGERDGKGAGGARNPPSEPASRQAVHSGECGRAAGDVDRERAVRPREGRVHRRGGAAHRSLRAGGHGDALSRRDR